MGTDEFRARIDAASFAKLDHAPWHGQGLGEAWAMLPDGATYSFHNSYWSMLVEGGCVYLVAMLVLTVWFGIRPLRPGPYRCSSPAARRRGTSRCWSARCNWARCSAPPRLWSLAAGLIGYLQAEPVTTSAGYPATVSR